MPGISAPFLMSLKVNVSSPTVMVSFLVKLVITNLPFLSLLALRIIESLPPLPRSILVLPLNLVDLLKVTVSSPLPARIVPLVTRYVQLNR